jgi:hypothetical protein
MLRVFYPVLAIAAALAPVVPAAAQSDTSAPHRATRRF